MPILPSSYSSLYAASTNLIQSLCYIAREQIASRADKVSDNSASATKDVRHFLRLCDSELLYERRRAEFERKIGALMHPARCYSRLIEGVHFKGFLKLFLFIQCVCCDFKFVFFSKWLFVMWTEP